MSTNTFSRFVAKYCLLSAENSTTEGNFGERHPNDKNIKAFIISIGSVICNVGCTLTIFS